jgi:ribonucleoside-triphosphate reductase
MDIAEAIQQSLLTDVQTDTNKEIQSYLGRSGWKIKENANSDISYSGLQAHVAREAVKNYALSRYSERVRKAYKEGYFHIHNLNDGIVPYCYGGDLFKLLKKGLRTGRINSKPAKHLSTAVDHMVNFLCTSQQEWAGAQAFSNVNILLAPFIAKDHLTFDEVKQDMQRLVFNVNYPSRASYQTPFTNLIFDMNVPKQLRGVPALDNGDTYDDFLDESYMILEAFNEVMGEGDADGNIFTFPIPTINLIKSTDFSSDLFYKIAETDAKFGNYFFMNYIGSGINEDSVQAMCCRLNLDLSQLPPAGGRWAMAGNTGSLGVVTLNLGRLGYVAHEEADIYTYLNFLLGLTRESLETKEIMIRESFANGLMPLAKEYDLNLERFFRTIGVVGLNELCLNFTGEPLSANLSLGAKVLDHIRDWTRQTQKETGKLWNLEMTPAEGCGTSLAIGDKAKYPDIITQGEGDSSYYTSLLTPPSEEISMVDRLRMEEPLLNKFTGGTVHRIFVGENAPNPEGLSKLIERIAKTTKVPYYDFAATFSMCKTNGHYMRGVHETCTECGHQADVYSRVTGYYRPISSYNAGKLKEFTERKYVSI